MGTKAKPSAFDCYDAAEPDEPMFHLLARDPSAPWLVRAWAALRAGDLASALGCMEAAAKALKAAGKPVLGFDSEKLSEARQCAREMGDWQEARAAT